MTGTRSVKRVSRPLSSGSGAVARGPRDRVKALRRGSVGADGTPGANGLSGLAKAFFYAGSRGLLVSHWPVVSDAAVALTTRMLAAAKTGLTRAEAHRQAMMAMIDAGPTHNAHPALWAPFVVVGEGGE